MTTIAIQPVVRPIKTTIVQPVPFQFVTRVVPCKHKAQLTLDYGSEPGPFVIIGINNHAFCLGYLPKKGKKTST